MADKVAGLLFKISADTKALRQGFKQTQKSVGTMQKQFSALGPIIAGAFSVRAIAGFTKEIIKLAGEAEGVEEAFAKIENSEKLLRDLTRATRGTVTQLQLMKYAVQAKNFKIPLEQLATYFEFATKRAAQTGESVDYLVNSLITGIGRKSVLVMDNLGISAVELQEEVKKVGDFGAAAGNIIERELGNMGEVSKTTAQEVATLAAKWTDVKTEIGKAITETSIFSETLAGITEDLGEVDWKNTINDIVEGFKKWYEQLILLNPALATSLGLIQAIRAGDKAARSKTTQGPSAATMDSLLMAQAAGRNLPKTKVTGSGGGLNLLGAGKKGILGGAYAMGGGLSSMTGKGFGISGGPKGNITPGAINSQGVMQFFTQLNTMGIKLKETTVPKIKEAMMDLSTVMQQTFMGAVDAFGQGVTNLFSGTAKLENFFQGILKAMGGFVTQMGKMIIAYGIGMLSLKKAFANPISAIAAGAALVAIGSAISGLASRGPAMAGGGGGAAGGGASMQISGTTKVQGRDIVIAYDRGLSLAGAVT